MVPPEAVSTKGPSVLPLTTMYSAPLKVLRIMILPAFVACRPAKELDVMLLLSIRLAAPVTKMPAPLELPPVLLASQVFPSM